MGRFDTEPCWGPPNRCGGEWALSGCQHGRYGSLEPADALGVLEYKSACAAKTCACHSTHSTHCELHRPC